MRTIKTSLVLVLVALVAACNTPGPISDNPGAATPAAATAATGGASRDVKPVVAASIDPLSDPKGALARRSIYFDYDSYVLGAAGQQVASSHSAYLNQNKRRRIIIQGNADERGGTEYNLALGQKRAEAVRKALAALGVAESQMEAVSLGENKPKATGANEAAWAENRRADIVY